MDLESGVEQAIAQGADVVALVAQNMVPEWQLVARGADSVAALRDKVVGISVGSSGLATITYAAKQAAVSLDSIVRRVMPESSGRAVALANGRIDAAVLDGSDVILLQEDLSDLRVLSRLADAGTVVAPVVFVANRKYVEKNGALVDRFVTEILNASDTLYSDDGREAFVRLALAGALEGKSPEVAGAVYDYYRSAALWPRRSRPVTEEQYRRTVRITGEPEHLATSVPFNRAWDLSSWERG